jgi:hypothetical protein
MRAIRCAIAALLAAGIVAMVGAQQPNRQRGGGGGDVYALVLTNKALQEELKITDAQKEKFKPAAEKQTELNKKRADAFKGGKGFDKDKRTELADEGKKVAEEVAKVLDAELTAEQKKRVKQISVQLMGVNVFGDPEAKAGGTGGGFGFGFGGLSDSQKATMKEVAEALKLSDAQKAKIKEMTDEYSKDRAAIRKDVFGDNKGGKGNFDAEKQKDYSAKTGKLSEEVMTKIVGVFDEGQKKTWKELTGDAFDTSKLNQGRGQPNEE